MGYNDDAWEKLFYQYDILNAVHKQGVFEISAAQIKPCREPRLMTKFDHYQNLPELFRRYGLSILPTTRGSYVISSFEAYRRFEPPSFQTQRVPLPENLQSLSPEFITSEALALNCAYSTGILADFLDDGALLPTTSGRMGSGSFSFSIGTREGARRVQVENAQIEIDAGYEGERSLSLIEAKMDLAEDFLIRQLYYPFRVWSARISKTIRQIFLIYTNGIFFLYEYRFLEPDNYNSLALVRQKNYVVGAGLSLGEFQETLARTKMVPEPPLPFPQADSLPRVINLLEQLQKSPMPKDDITQRYGFTPRQTSYYTDAGRYLGLMERERRLDCGTRYSLTREGRSLLKLPYRERQLALFQCIIRHKVFHDAVARCLCLSRPLIKREAVELMKQSPLYGVVSDSTYTRRASTVQSWSNWCLQLLEKGSL